MQILALSPELRSFVLDWLTHGTSVDWLAHSQVPSRVSGGYQAAGRVATACTEFRNMVVAMLHHRHLKCRLLGVEARKLRLTRCLHTHHLGRVHWGLIHSSLQCHTPDATFERYYASLLTQTNRAITEQSSQQLTLKLLCEWALFFDLGLTEKIRDAKDIVDDGSDEEIEEIEQLVSLLIRAESVRAHTAAAESVLPVGFENWWIAQWSWCDVSRVKPLVPGLDLTSRLKPAVTLRAVRQPHLDHLLDCLGSEYGYIHTERAILYITALCRNDAEAAEQMLCTSCRYLMLHDRTNDLNLIIGALFLTLAVLHEAFGRTSLADAVMKVACMYHVHVEPLHDVSNFCDSNMHPIGLPKRLAQVWRDALAQVYAECEQSYGYMILHPDPDCGMRMLDDELPRPLPDWIEPSRFLLRRWCGLIEGCKGKGSSELIRRLDPEEAKADGVGCDGVYLDGLREHDDTKRQKTLTEMEWFTDMSSS